MATDHYATLGVTTTSTPEEIQKAYRKLARKYHPDMNPNDATAKKKFQEVQSAFEVLSDPDKRKKYDQFGDNFESMGAGGPGGGPRWRHTGSGGGPQSYQFDMNDLGDMFGGGGGGGGGFETEGSGGFADIFKQFSRGRGGGGRRPAPATKGNDLKHDLTIPFATAVLGGEAALSVQRQDGDVESIRVKIPAGIEDGKKIRLRGQGVPGIGDAPAGDILLTIHISPHPQFRRTGNRLEVQVPITLAEAALGGKVDVPTPHGEGGKPGIITLTVPPNTSSGKRLRIKGHGVRPANQPAGDLFAEIQVELPNQMTDAERQELAEISNRHPQNPRSELRW
ncbi:MAG TPA: J domain-containing protein [Lacipirellulaceae bacterium]|nr:J domain-containing protein [Lacipirellulaceae bacterium]